MEKIENYGVFVDIKSTDKVAGWAGELPYEVRLPSGDWTPWLAGKERQSPPETMACVSFSCNHCVDTQMNWLIETGQFSKEAILYFKDAGYTANGSFNSSDRWLAIRSGTTTTGNSQQKVLDTMRHKGLLPEIDLPFGGNTFYEYHNPKVITPAMDAKALKILDYIKIDYQWIFQKDDGSNIPAKLQKYLKMGCVQDCISICSSFMDGSDPAKTCGLRIPQHCIAQQKIDTAHRTLDQYHPYLKNLALDYPLLYGLLIVVTSKSKPVLETKTITTESGQIHTTETPDFWATLKRYLTQWGIKFKESVGSIIRGK
jgi:hypothetical protein